MINDELLHKWLNNTINSDELAQFKLRPEYDNLVALHGKIENLEAPQFDGDKMLNHILASEKQDKLKAQQSPKEAPVIQMKSESSKSMGIPNWIKMGLAASFLILAGIFMWPDQEAALLTFSPDKQKQGTFPDGSSFVLAANSTLEYDKTNWTTNRTVLLKGDAQFKVKKGSRFLVDTQNGTVEVLGTEFHVSSLDNHFSVQCKSGKVSAVSKITDHKEILTAEESIFVNREGEVKSIKKGISKFKNVPMKQVQMALMKEFNVDIKADGIGMSELVSCNFQHQDLEAALKTVFSPMNIKYEIASDKSVRLFKN